MAGVGVSAFGLCRACSPGGSRTTRRRLGCSRRAAPQHPPDEGGRDKSSSSSSSSSVGVIIMWSKNQTPHHAPRAAVAGDEDQLERQRESCSTIRPRCGECRKRNRARDGTHKRGRWCSREGEGGGGYGEARPTGARVRPPAAGRQPEDIIHACAQHQHEHRHTSSRTSPPPARAFNFPLKIFRLIFSTVSFDSLLNNIDPVFAKTTSGSVNLGNRDPPFVYISKMGYDIGEGSYALRFQTARAGVLEKPVNLKIAIFLDEEWEEHGLDSNQYNVPPTTSPETAASYSSNKGPNEPKNICDYVQYAKSLREVTIPAGMTADWSVWEKGALKQVVRPHVWYFVAYNCDRQWPEKTKLKFQFEAKQHDGSHFSKEMDGMMMVYLFKLVLFGVYGFHYLRLKFDFKRSSEDEKIHPVVWVLTAVIFMQVIGTFTHYMHLWVYSNNGYGVKVLDVVNSLLQAIIQVTIQSLLILIALGYTLLQKSLGDLDIVLPVVFVIIVVNLLLVAFSKLKDDASYKFYENEGTIGVFVLTIRFALYSWFCYALFTTKAKSPSKMTHFLNTRWDQVAVDRFFVAGSLYFLSYPVMYVIAGLFAAYLRHKVMVVGGFLTFAVSIRWLENLFLNKRGEFYQVSTLGSSFLPGGTQWGFAGAKGE